MTTASTKAGAAAYNNQDANVVSWLLAQGETGDAINLSEFADRSVHFLGTFGGATVVLEGSNDTNDATTRYATLTDPLGNSISRTSAGLRAVTEMTRLVRPKVTGGDGTTAIEVFLMAKR